MSHRLRRLCVSVCDAKCSTLALSAALGVGAVLFADGVQVQTDWGAWQRGLGVLLLLLLLPLLWLMMMVVVVMLLLLLLLLGPLQALGGPTLLVPRRHRVVALPVALDYTTRVAGVAEVTRAQTILLVVHEPLKLLHPLFVVILLLALPHSSAAHAHLDARVPGEAPVAPGRAVLVVEGLAARLLATVSALAPCRRGVPGQRRHVRQMLPALRQSPGERLAIVPHPSGAEAGDRQVELLLGAGGGGGREGPGAGEAGRALGAVGVRLVSVCGAATGLDHHCLRRTVGGWGGRRPIDHLLIGRQQVTGQEPWRELTNTEGEIREGHMKGEEEKEEMSERKKERRERKA